MNTDTISERFSERCFAVAMQAQSMQQAADDTIGQRINRLFQEQDKVTIDDLLGVVKNRDEVYSHAFNWAIVKLVWKLDSKSQEYRDVHDFARGVGRYGSVLAQTAPRFQRVMCLARLLSLSERSWPLSR